MKKSARGQKENTNSQKVWVKGWQRKPVTQDVDICEYASVHCINNLHIKKSRVFTLMNP